MDWSAASPTSVSCVIVGAGFAGVATAWALARAGLRDGVILEREATPGVHASGRNAALARQVERDPVVLALAMRSIARIRELSDADELVRATGSITVAGSAAVAEVTAAYDASRAAGLAVEIMSARSARARFPFLERLRFDTALWCPADGVVDIHALLMRYLNDAQRYGYRLFVGRAANELLIQGGRAAGVRSGSAEIRADIVVDSSGAWAGRLAGDGSRVSLQPLRRHLFTTGPLEYVGRTWPYVWNLGGAFYFRPEGDGLLLSPCDETPSEPGSPSTDPEAALLLARKLSAHAPGLGDLTIRRQWACLRTFAFDRRPVIGPDPAIPGLFHVSGLGGFGMTASAAVGELAASLIIGPPPEWIDAAAVSPARLWRARETRER